MASSGRRTGHSLQDVATQPNACNAGVAASIEKDDYAAVDIDDDDETVVIANTSKRRQDCAAQESGPSSDSTWVTRTVQEKRVLTKRAGQESHDSNAPTYRQGGADDTTEPVKEVDLDCFRKDKGRLVDSSFGRSNDCVETQGRREQLVWQLSSGAKARVFQSKALPSFAQDARRPKRANSLPTRCALDSNDGQLLETNSSLTQSTSSESDCSQRSTSGSSDNSGEYPSSNESEIDSPTRKSTRELSIGASPDRQYSKSEDSLDCPNAATLSVGALVLVDDFVENTDTGPLLKLENVTAQSRSLIPPELLRKSPKKRGGRFKQNHKKRPLDSNTKSIRRTMTTTSTQNGDATSNKSGRKGFFGKRILNRKKSNDFEGRNEGSSHGAAVGSDAEQNGSSNERLDNSSRHGSSSTASSSQQAQNANGGSEREGVGRRGVLERLRSASRSRSRSRSAAQLSGGDNPDTPKPVLVAVTSCRSDAYYNQNAPGSTSKLPRKAPSNLKLFHELAVGLKDAYAAVGQTPTRPDAEEQENQSAAKPSPVELEGKTILWEFVGNLDFVSAPLW